MCLSPILFNDYSEEIISTGRPIRGLKVNGVPTDNRRYTDDDDSTGN